MIKIEKLCINWLNENYSQMEPFETEEYPTHIFYRKNRKVIFEYNKKNGVVYIDRDEIWLFFENFFSMNCGQIQSITKIWVEGQFKLKVTAIHSRNLQLSGWWRDNSN